LKSYLCTIFNHDCTTDQQEAPLGSHYAPAVRVARVLVFARNGQEAAARAYVRTVGRVRARKMREFNAPACCLMMETCRRTLAGGLGRVSNWLVDCFVYETQGQRTKNVKMGDLASSADLAFH
jgi:hypothetical protein